jgi:hypothetical protein
MHVVIGVNQFGKCKQNNGDGSESSWQGERPYSSAMISGTSADFFSLQQ